MTNHTRILLALCPLAASMTLACGGDELDAEPMDLGAEAKPRIEHVQLTRLELISEDAPTMLHPVEIAAEFDVKGDAFDSDLLVGLTAEGGELGCVLGALEAKTQAAGQSHLALQSEFFVKADCARLLDRDDVELFAAFDPWGGLEYERQGTQVDEPMEIYDIMRGSMLDTTQCDHCRVETTVADSPGLDAQLREVDLDSTVAVLSLPAGPDQAMPSNDVPHFAIATGARVTGLGRGQAPRDGEVSMTHRIRPAAGAQGTDELDGPALRWAPLLERHRDDQGVERDLDEVPLDVRGQTQQRQSSILYIGDDLAARMHGGDWQGVEEFELQTCVSTDFEQAVYAGEIAPRDNDCAVFPVVVVREYLNPDGSRVGSEDLLPGGGKARTAQVWSTGWSTTNTFAGNNYTNGINFETWLDLNASDVATTTYGGRPVTSAGSWFEAGAKSIATVFNNNVTLLDAYLTAIGYNNLGGGIEAKVQAMGFNIIDTGYVGSQDGVELTLEAILQAAGKPTTTTWDAELTLAGYSFDDGCSTVSAGVFLKGEIGLDNQASKVNIDGLPSGVSVSGTIAPTAAISVESRAEFGYDGFLSINVALTMAIDIIRIVLPFTATATVTTGTPNTLTMTQSADLTLSSLAGYIAFAFDYEFWCPAFWNNFTCTGEHNHTLVSWDGVSTTFNLFNLSQSFNFGPGIAPVASGYDDLIWRHNSGQVDYWTMDDTGVPTGHSLLDPVALDFTLVGSGDVNGDGWDDIIWQHSSGMLHYWDMNNGQVIGGGGHDIANPGADWTIAGIGDVNSDGTDDIVFQHTNGMVHYWDMQGGQVIGGGGHNIANAGADWKAVGVGDITSDGTDDIIFRNAGGQVHYWDMQGGVIKGGGGHNLNAPVTADWHIRGAGDVNGDGTDDIVWQNDAGQVHYWRMNNGASVSSHNIGAPVGNDYTLDGVGDIG